MKTKFLNALSLALIVAMLVTSFVLADEVVNNIDNSIDSGPEQRTIVAGGSTTVGFYINDTSGGGDLSDCNVDADHPATVTFNVANVTANPSSIQFTSCGAASKVDVLFSSSTVGTWLVKPDAPTGGKDGSKWDRETAKFNLEVTAPSDTTAPVITPNVVGTFGNNGWYVSDVTVSWTVVDDESAISSTDGCDETTIDYDTDGVTLTCTATSAGGTASESVTIMRDATAPSISAVLDKSPDGVTGWFNLSTGAPTVDFTCSDTTSGLAGACPASYLFGEGADQSYSQTIYDNAGNSASAGVSDVDVDLTVPSITITTPAAGASYLLNQEVAADYGCSDGTSGVATCVGPVANGANIDTSIGSKNFTVNASDVAGNTNTATNSYTVNYAVCALYDQTKSHKLGSTVPVKLQLCDAFGANQSSASIVVKAYSLTKVDNNASGILDDSGYANSPDSNFRYDATLGGSGGYIFNLSTKPLSKGTWKLTFTVDGLGSYSVQFDVK